MLEAGELGPQGGEHGGMVEAAEHAGHDGHAGFQTVQHEAQLAGPVDRRDRVHDRAESGRRQQDHHELLPVGELARDHPPALDAVGGEPVRHPLDRPRELGVGAAAGAVHHGHLGRPAGGPAIEVALDTLVPPQPAGGAVADALGGEVGLERRHDVRNFLKFTGRFSTNAFRPSIASSVW